MPPSPPPSPPPPSDPFPKTCGCGARYDGEAWKDLVSRGPQPTDPGKHLELRICAACGSTLSIEKDDEPAT